MRKRIHKSSSGFTVVELLVSTVIFSLLLLGAMAAMVQIGRMYYKGITTARTQEFTRNIVSELSQTIAFSRDPIDVSGQAASNGPFIATGSTAAGTGFYCIGPRRYSYVIDRKLISSSPSAANRETRHVLWLDTPDGGCAGNEDITVADLSADNPCADPAICTNGREMVGENMRLTTFSLENEAGTAIWNIDAGLAYGDDETPEQDRGPLAIQGGKYQCLGGSFLVQFCALSEINTSAIRRLGG